MGPSTTHTSDILVFVHMYMYTYTYIFIYIIYIYICVHEYICMYMDRVNPLTHFSLLELPRASFASGRLPRRPQERPGALGLGLRGLKAPTVNDISPASPTVYYSQGFGM